MGIPVVRRLSPPSILFMPRPFFIVFMSAGERARRTGQMSRRIRPSMSRWVDEGNVMRVTVDAAAKTGE